MEKAPLSLITQGTGTAGFLSHEKPTSKAAALFGFCFALTEASEPGSELAGCDHMRVRGKG